MERVNRGKRLRQMGKEEYRAHLQRQVLRNSVPHENGCRLWAGTIHPNNGYGGTRVFGKNTTAHRAAYYAFVGDIPDGHEVCHRCDVRHCVEPSHLFTALHDVNMTDMSQKGRGRNGVMSGAYIPERNEAGRFVKLQGAIFG